MPWRKTYVMTWQGALGQMNAAGSHVISTCRCGASDVVDLDEMIELLGEDDGL